MTINKTLIFLILIICSFIFASCAKNEITNNKEVLITGKANVNSTLNALDDRVPDGWVIFSKPNAESGEIQCANASRKEWKVETENGNVKISKYSFEGSGQIEKLPEELKKRIAENRNVVKGLGGYLHVEPFDNGWLIGSDAGEWGGKLFWFGEDGRQKLELLNDNVRGIVRVGNEIFVLSGMAHMEIDEGKIYRLTKGEKLKLKLISDLKTQPQSFAVENDSLIVALNDKIIRVKTSGEIETIKETNFNTLYPNSMAITSSGIIYVGSRLFVVRFVPFEKSYKEEWLVQQNCRKFVEKDFDCVCQNEK